MFPLLFHEKRIEFKNIFFSVKKLGLQGFTFKEGFSPLFSLNLNSFLLASDIFLARPCILYRCLISLFFPYGLEQALEN